MAGDVISRGSGVDIHSFAEALKQEIMRPGSVISARFGSFSFSSYINGSEGWERHSSVSSA